MVPRSVRKVGYAAVAAYGLFATLAPRLASKLGVRAGLLGFDNVGELETRDWYARAVRAAGVGMLAAGGTGLLLESRAADTEADTGDTTEEEDTGEDSDEPVEIDV